MRYLVVRLAVVVLAAAAGLPAAATAKEAPRPAASKPVPAGWTDWRGGPRRDSQSAHVPKALPAECRFLWRTKLTSQSLGGIAATTKRVLCSDKSPDGGSDIWRCLDADTGKELWQLRYAAEATKMDYTSAPRATPVIVGEKVYLLGALGDLHCVGLADGRVLWKCNLLARFGGKVPTWGFCGTPLAIGEKLVVNAVAPEAALVAFHRHSGKVLWKTPGRAPGYGNLILGQFGGRRQIVGYDVASAGGWDPETGKRLWTLLPGEGEEFNVPTPLAADGQLLLATEKSGTRLYGFRDDGMIDPQPVAVNRELAPDITSPVLADGAIWASCYGGMFCLDPALGLQCLWKTEDDAFRDAASLIAGNGRVLIALKSGILALVPARPGPGEKPATLRVFQAGGDFEPELWSQPALVGDRLYLRNENSIVCLRLGS